MLTFTSPACVTAVFPPVLCRMSHARGKAEAAEGVAQKATEECRLARIAAKELSPSFHIYGNGERTKHEEKECPTLTQLHQLPHTHTHTHTHAHTHTHTHTRPLMSSVRLI